MRIVDKETFLSMPRNTVFSKVKNDGSFGSLCVLAKKGGGDFWFKEINDQWDNLTDALDAGDDEPRHRMEDILPINISVNMIEEVRDGEVGNKGQLFAVWERKEILFLLGILAQCVNPEERTITTLVINASSEVVTVKEAVFKGTI